MSRLLLLLCCLTLAPALARPITPELLQSLPRVGECRVSPDGRWLAVEVTPTPGHGELRIYPFSLSPAGKPLATFPKATHPRWSPRQLLVEAPVKGHGQVFTCETGSWKLAQLTHHGEGVEAPLWSPDGHKIAFMSRVLVRPSPWTQGNSGRLYDDTFERRWKTYYDGKRQHLFVQEPGQNQARDVTPGDFDAYPTSSTFSAGDNYCFSQDGRALLFSAPPAHGQASETNYDLYRVDLASLKRENLTAANLAADIGPCLNPQGTRLYILSQQRHGYESDFYRVRSCAVDPSGKPQGDWQAQGPNGDFSVSDYLPAQDGAYFSRLDGPAVKACWQSAQGEIRTLDLAGSLHGLSCDRSGHRWAGIQAALNLPPRLVVGEGPKHAALTLVAGPALELGAVESVQVPVEGASMQMWLIKPPNFTPQRRWPVAYLIHGGPQGAWTDDWSLRWNPQVWAAQGYLVAMPNPHGSSDQGLAYQEQVSRDWGGRPYRDLMAGADYLAALDYVDPQRMLAAGASYGGYMINWISVHTGRFKCLVSHDGIWNLDSMYGSTDELWFPDWEFGGPPWGTTLGDYEKFSPHRFADQLGRFKTPMMLIHNDLDYRCPLEQGLALFAALKLQGVPTRLLNFPDEGHHVLKPGNSLRWYPREVFAFVRRYCPPNH